MGRACLERFAGLPSARVAGVGGHREGGTAVLGLACPRVHAL